MEFLLNSHRYGTFTSSVFVVNVLIFIIVFYQVEHGAIRFIGIIGEQSSMH